MEKLTIPIITLIVVSIVYSKELPIFKKLDPGTH